MHHAPDASEDDLTYEIIGRAIDVHKRLGPSFSEAINRDALVSVLKTRGLDVKVEAPFPIEMEGMVVAHGKADVVVEREVVLELKVVKRLTDSHFGQLGRNVRGFPGANRGLLLNFGEPTLTKRRFVL
jgi:GxxExxY protein